MDWNKIRKDYIAGKGSYRELAKKYGVPFRTLADRAKAEGWVALRGQVRDKTASKTVENVASNNAKVDTSVQDAAIALINQISAGVRKTSAADYKALKSYSSALRDLKDILDLRSDLDVQEQMARIAKLRAEVERTTADENTEITVTLGSLEDWAR